MLQYTSLLFVIPAATGFFTGCEWIFTGCIILTITSFWFHSTYSRLSRTIDTFYAHTYTFASAVAAAHNAVRTGCMFSAGAVAMSALAACIYFLNVTGSNMRHAWIHVVGSLGLTLYALA